MATQYYCAASLDGYIADSDDGLEWLTGYEGSYGGEEAVAGPMGEGGTYDRFYEGVGAMISGSKTYEFVLGHGSEWPYGGKPYWVLSSRDLALPDDDDADVRIANTAVGELHEELVAAAGDRNVWVLGGGAIASQFAAEGLLDELLLTIVPVVLGSGKPLFERASGEQGMPEALQMTGTTTYRTGMVELRYALGGR